MGRSVLSASQADAVAYTTFFPDEEFYGERFDEEFNGDDDAPDFKTWMYNQWNVDAEHEWQYYQDGTQEDVIDFFPSMEEADGWNGDENKILARNAHSEVTISEYCGAVAISLAPRSDFGGDHWEEEDRLSNLGNRWRESVAKRFERRFGDMVRLGGLSDGTSVYRIDA